jgi:hypothetical protein
MLVDRFGRDQQELLIRKLFHIKQKGYVAEFAELVDQLVSYGHSTDQLYYVTTFIEGLHDDIRPTVLVQHPSTLDASCLLALLQEEAGNSHRRRGSRCVTSGSATRPPP